MQLVTPSGERHQAHLTCDHWASPFRPVLAYRDASGRLQTVERTPRPGWQLSALTPDEIGTLVQLGYVQWVMRAAGRNPWAKKVSS